MSSRPTVSVITPIYNCSRFLRETAASVQAQTLPDWELLLVDDCSRDGSFEEACRLATEDSRIRVLRTEVNSGPAVSRNLALENASGRYAAFLDGDDLWHPEKLEHQLCFMEKKKAAFSCTAYDRISEDGSAVLGRVTPFTRLDYNGVLYRANPVGNSTAVYDREALGEFRVPFIRKRNDFALWLAVLKKTDYVYGMQECLGCYRVRESSVSSQKLDLVRYQWQLYRHVEGLSLPKVGAAFAGLAYTMAFRPTWHGADWKKQKSE